MNTHLLPLAVSTQIPPAIKKKRVLLVDTSHIKRDLRADALRQLGIEVDCAADIGEARSWWKPALYDLVLINLKKDAGQRDRFCDDLRSAMPPQRLAFLVGQPGYLADLPNEELETQNEEEQIDTGIAKSASRVDSENSSQRWGILDASRRISAVRSAAIARGKATRALPPPPRDAEGRSPKSSSTSSRLDDLLKEELR